MMNKPTQIIVHHSAADSPSPQYSSINQWHKARGFPVSRKGAYVGYHYVIEKDGTITQAREHDEEGAHTIGQNRNSIGICLVGNLSKTAPTGAQETALAKLLSALCAEYKISAYAISPHRKYKATDCFGGRLLDNWAALLYLRYEIERLRDVAMTMGLRWPP